MTKYKLGEIIELNPRESIKKGNIARKIAMDDLGEFKRDIESYSYSEYKGGTKFRNYDTLMARITPCLENGKTSFVNILEENEVAFGSTEYFVFRAKQDIINPYYLYYLVTTDKFREVAIKSMSGTSGRQRVQKDQILDFSVDLPSLEDQEKIMKPLKLIDDKISLNTKLNTNLLRQIKLISNSYFSYFEVFDGKIPTNWKYFKLTDIANLGTGYSYSSKDLQKNNNMAMATIKNFNRNFGFDSRGYKEIIPIKPIKKEKYANLFDILVAHTDLTQNADIIGNAEPVLNTGNYEQIIYSMDLVKVTPKDNKISPFLLSLILQGDMFKSHCMKYINGTTVLHLSKQALKDFELPLPKNISDLNELDEFATKAYKTLSNNIIENTVLEKIKSTLLNTLF